MFGANIKRRTVQECLAETASELYKDFVSSIVNSFLLGFSPRLLRANPQFKQTAKTGKIATQSATIPWRGEILHPVFRQRLNADGVAEASAASLARFPTGVLRRKEGSDPRSCLQPKGARPPLPGAGEGHRARWGQHRDCPRTGREVPSRPRPFPDAPAPCRLCAGPG